MEVSQKEKDDLYSRLSAVETGVDHIRTTMVVGGSLMSAFFAIVVLVGGWWLNVNFTKFDLMYTSSLQNTYSRENQLSENEDRKNEIRELERGLRDLEITVNNIDRERNK